MALSARMISATIPSFTANMSVVILNEIGKSGILRTLGAVDANSNSFTIKIEIDGVIVFNRDKQFLFGTGNSANPPHGMGVTTSLGTSGNSVSSISRLLNMPFKDSIKITMTNNAVAGTNFNYNADYVLDL